jgi:iron complex transport system ATP-binding protein
MILSARNLHADLGRRAVLNGVDLETQPRTITAVIGPNGAGKSTLLRALAGLVPVREGRILLDNLPLSHWSRTDRARVLAYVPQERTVHWALEVRSIVALGRLPHQADGAGESEADSKAIAAAMADMDVAHLAERPVTDVSGGELARVLIARALAQEPQVLIADEPAAGLDPAHQLALFRCFTRIAEAGRNVVVALHDLSLAARFCHNILLMQAGRVVAAGSPESVLDASHLRTAYGVDAKLHTLDGIPVVQVASELP